MKKITFLICTVFAFLLKVNAQGPQLVSTEKQNRNVIIEEFTGRNCQYCPDGHVVANNIVKNNPGRAWAVNIHSGNYAPTNYPNFNTTDGDAIRLAIHSGGFPSGSVNRCTTTSISRYEWSTYANQQLSQSAECNIAGQVVINTDTRVATITVEVYYTSNSLSSKNYLTVMMLQDNIIGSQSGADYNPDQQTSDGRYNHMHVLRDVITSTWGDEISPTVSGTLITKTYSYAIPQTIGSPNGVDVKLEDLVFVAFVTEKQDGAATRPMLNVNELDIIEGYDVEVSATVNPANAGVVNGTGTYSYGENVVLAAIPSNGYKFVNWTENGEIVSVDSEYSFTIVNDRSLVANFVMADYKVITASVNPKNAGTVVGAGGYDNNETVTLTAIPNEGYKFVNWTEDEEVVSSDAEYTFTITGDRYLIANFALLDYDVEVAVNPEDAGEIRVLYLEESFEEGELPQGWYVYNDNPTTPTNKPVESQSWKVIDAYSDIAPKDGEYYAASIGENYYNDARHYLVTPKIEVPAASTMEFSYVNPKRDGHISRLFLYMSTSPIGPWTEVWSTKHAKSTSKWTDVNVDLAEYAGQEVYFSFCNKYSEDGSWTAIDDFAIIGSSAINSGVVGNYNHGDNVKLLATANDGYKFVNWTENDEVVSKKAEYSFIITEGRNLVANFGLIGDDDGNDDGGDVVVTEYNVDVTINLENAGTITGAGTYVENDTVVLLATANDGYKFVNWTENDEVVSEEAEYSFTITNDRNLVANFVSTEGIGALSSSLNIYPNPVNDKLYIVTEDEVKEVIVYDVYGRHQVTETPSHQGNMTVDVKNLSNGIYFVRVKTENGEIVKRFVKK